MSKKKKTHARWAGQKGYLLLAVMLLITLMLIVLAAEAPRIAQQIKREKEEELVHRGKEYAIAIKKFYHKNGTYPLSLDQLESTNNLRFLRRRYKDPMTSSGEWKLIHVGEGQINIPTTPSGAPNTGTLSTSPPGGATPAATPNNTAGLNSGGFNPSPGFGPGGVQTGAAGSNQPGGGGQLGTLNTQNIGTGLGPNAQGGGPIIGVASKSTNKAIKEFNGASEYDLWLFVYDPRLEQVPGGGGVVIASPRSGSAAGGASGGVPAGVLPSAPAGQPGGTPAPTPVVIPTPQAIPQ